MNEESNGTKAEEIKTVAALTKELGLILPHIPDHSKELFFEILAEEYGKKIQTLVDTNTAYLKKILELASSSFSMNIVIPAAIWFLNKFANEATDEQTAAEKIRFLKEAIKHAALEVNSKNDPLTGLGNRRFLDEVIQQKQNWLVTATEQWKEKKIGEEIILVFMIDVDYLKEINDSHGHVGGDEFLKQVADSLTQIIKQGTDSAFRYGGDEFTLILQVKKEELVKKYGEPEEEAIEKFSKEIHSRISDKIYDITSSDGVAQVKSSLSIGVVKMTTEEFGNETILKADRKLYQAKLRGRNQVAT